MAQTETNHQVILSHYIERLGRSYTFRVYWRFGKFRQTQSVDVKAYDMQ